MSRLGKAALFLNVALGIFFAVWGFGLFSNRIDWKAETKERSDLLRKLGDARNKVLEQVEATRNLPVAQDNRRPVLDKFYADQLENLRNGKGRPKALVYSKGVLQYDAQGLPRLGEVVNSANQPIPGIASHEDLRQQYAALQEQIRQTVAEETKLIEEEKQLSAQLYGDGDQKSHRGVLADRIAAEQKSLQRQEQIMPLLYNRQAEVQVLTKRREGLESRLKELQSANTSAQP
jgi:cell division protein FtsB